MIIGCDVAIGVLDFYATAITRVPLGFNNCPVTSSQDRRTDWRGPINALKSEIAWFRKEGRHAFEIVTLPVLQLLATAINFFVVIITARPMFSLPFTSIDHVMAMTPKWTRAHHAAANVALEPRPAAQGGAS